MRSVLAVVSFAALAAPAVVAAQPAPVGKITPPAGWTADVGRASSLENIIDKEGHFDDAKVHVSAQHLQAPTPGGILLINEIVTQTPPAKPDDVASRELHDARTVQGLGESVQVVRTTLTPAADGRVHEALAEWKDKSLETTSIARTLVFRTNGNLVHLSARCVIADHAPALRAPCEAALASLAPLAAPAEIEPLTIATEPPPRGPEPDRPPPPPPAPRMSETDREIPTTLMVTPREKKRDRRPLYVLAGIVVLAAVYWWNRRERARLEAESKAAEPPLSPAPLPRAVATEAKATTEAAAESTAAPAEPVATADEAEPKEPR